MVEAWILTIFCGMICAAAVIDKFLKLFSNNGGKWNSTLQKLFTHRKVIKMNTIEYLQIFDIVRQQLEHVFRDSTLPPNMIDTMAHTRAVNEAMKLHRQKQLVTYYNRMKAGAV